MPRTSLSPYFTMRYPHTRGGHMKTGDRRDVRIGSTVLGDLPYLDNLLLSQKPAVSLHADPVPVGADGDHAVYVGAQDGGVMLAQASHDGGVRVPVAILEPGRDHGEGRLHRAQELLRPAGTAPMVRHLEHVGGPHILGVEHLVFDSALHITAQEQAALPEGHAHRSEERRVGKECRS